MSRIFIWLAVLFAAAPAFAGINNPGRGTSGATGSAQLNLGPTEFIPANLINVLRTASIGFNTLSDAGKLDDDGYLTSSPVGDVSISFPAAGTSWNNVQYKLRWDAGVQFSDLLLNITASSCTAVNATFTGCTGSSAHVTTTGGAGSVVFTMASAQFSLFFKAGSTNSHSSGALSLYRLSDEADFLAGEIFTPEFKTVLKGLNPKTIRVMGWVQRGAGNFNGETTWNYRVKPTTLAWGSRFPPGAWTGAVTGTNQYTSPAAADTPLSGWVAGEVLVGSIANPSSALITVSNAANNGVGLCRLTVSTTAALATNQQVWVSDVELSTGEPNLACSNAIFSVTVIDGTTIDLQGTTFSGTYKASTGAIGTQTLTVTGKTGGAKFIASSLGFPLGYVNGSNVTAGIGTIVYDSILDKVLYASGGIQGSLPVEAQANLANKINANLWSVVPAWTSDDYVTNWATTLCSNLNSSLYLYPEYSNEVWNPSFPQTPWSTQRGEAFGWTQGSGQAVSGWYSLRVRQIMGNLIPATSCASHLLRRVMSYQAAGDGSIINNRFKGAQLTPGNAAYNAYTGSANYSAKPNRPIDVTEVIAYAPYASGTNLCTGPDSNCIPTAANAPFYQALVTAWEGGQSATAIASIDNDIRQGTTLSRTVTASGTTFTTSSAHSFTANSTDIIFQVTGGTLYSGLAVNTLYRVTSTPLTTTFTIQPYVGGFPSGASVNAGSAGSGTVTVGASVRQNLTNLASTWYQFGEANAALFDGDRPVAMANVRVEQYEGNPEPKGLSAAQCTALSISGTNCTGSIAAAILAWKNDPMSALTQQAYYNQFIGTDASMPPTFGLMPHSKTPSQLTLSNSCGGGSDYALLSDCLPNSTPFQLYNGFAAFHGVVNFLLKRDLDPASNDNDPVWLVKAA